MRQDPGEGRPFISYRRGGAGRGQAQDKEVRMLRGWNAIRRGSNFGSVLLAASLQGHVLQLEAALVTVP